MDPVTSTVLEALSAGAKSIATDEVKHIYSELKKLIQQKWNMKLPLEEFLSEYREGSESRKQELAKKLEQSGIFQDKKIVQKAEQLLQKVNVSETVNQSRNASSGHTATSGGSVSEDTISAGQMLTKSAGILALQLIINKHVLLGSLH